MAQPMSLRGRQAGRRTKVAVIYEDVTTGFRCADWLAQHGYQATLTSGATSASHQLERNLRELHPDVIVVGVSSAPAPLERTVPRLKSTCPQVPIIAMVNHPVDLRRNGESPDRITPLSPDVFLCHSLDPPSHLSEPLS